METSNKQKYFQFFHRKTHTSSQVSRTRQQVKRYEPLKLLPHITEEYNYRITNHLLIKRIISPKRDKTIVHSLQAVNNRKSHNSQSQHFSRSVTRQHIRTKQHISTPLQMQSCKGQGQTSIYEKDLQQNSQSLFVQPRLSQKFIKKNSKSILKTHINMLVEQQIVKDKKYMKLFSHDSLYKRQKQNKKEYIYASLIYRSDSFGFGSTILLITHLQVQVNPPIKQDSLIQLELIERAAINRPYRNIIDHQSEKTIKTTPFPYYDLPNNSNANSGIKFSIKLVKIGDFIPLRIWRYTGVDSILVGSIDLPLVSYCQDEGESINSNQLKQNIEWKYKKDNSQYVKKVFCGQVQRHLQKNKMLEADAIAKIKYKVYPKRFNKKKDNISYQR